MPHESNGHVLIVDDDASIKRMFQLLLKDAGYRVSTAGSSVEALQFLKILTPDVILLDISMPGITGVELTRRIKSDPQYPFIPIILITALGDMKTKIAGLDAGADDYLVKPVEFAELLARLRVMIRLQQSRRSLYESNRQVETLLKVTQVLTSSLDVDTLLQRMAQELADSLGAVRGSIILANGDQPFYASAAQHVPSAAAISSTLRDGVAGWVMRSRRSLLLADARRDSRWNTLGREQDTTRSVLAVPILNEHDVLGVITLVHSSVGYFQDYHRELVESVAAQSALALRHARLFVLTTQQKEQLELRSHLLEEILNVSERLRLNLPLPAMLDEIAEAIHRSLGFDAVVIHIYRHSGTEAAQGYAGVAAAPLADFFTRSSLENDLLPLFRTRFRLSRSYFIPHTYDSAQLDAPDVDLDFDLVSTREWQSNDRLIVPIGPATHPLGVIAVSDPLDQRVPDQATAQALEIFADQVSNAVKNKQIFGAERERANQLQLLVEVGRNLTELMTPDQLLRLVTSLIQHTFAFWSVAVLLYDERKLTLRAAAHTGLALPPLGMQLSVQGALARIVEHQQSIYHTNSADLCLNYTWIDEPVRSELAVPILARNQVLGVLIVGSNHDQAFDAVTESLLSTLAAQLAVAMENARLFGQEQKQVQQLIQVNALSMKLTALSINERLQGVISDVAQIFAVSQAVLLLLDLQEHHAWLVDSADSHISVDDLPSFAALADYVAQIELQFVQAAADGSVLTTILARAQLERALLVPLSTSERVTGVLLLADVGRDQRWTSSERNLAQTVANLLTQTIENSLLYTTVAAEQRTLSAVLASAADPIIVVGSQSELLLFNRAARESLNLDAHDIRQPVRHPLLLSMIAADAAALHEYTLDDGRIVQPSIARLVDSENSADAGKVLLLQDITAIKLLEQQRMQRLHDDMSRYMAPQLVEQLLNEGSFGAITERDVVVLFADLRGFTALSEGLSPRIVVEQVLNRFFTEMTNVLYEYEATIDKFLGDGIMAVFGSVRQRSDDVDRAIATAVAMQRAFRVLHDEWQAQLGRSIGLGIGMSFGRAVVGNLGSPQRLDYTLIGDVVNTASRLVDLAESGQIIVSQTLVDQLVAIDRTSLTPLAPVALKGKVQPLAIYSVEYTTASAEA